MYTSNPQLVGKYASPLDGTARLVNVHRTFAFTEIGL